MSEAEQPDEKEQAKLNERALSVAYENLRQERREVARLKEELAAATAPKEGQLMDGPEIREMKAEASRRAEGHQWPLVYVTGFIDGAIWRRYWNAPAAEKKTN